MHSPARVLSSLFRTVSFAVIAALIMILATVPAWAQNSVPPTAVQAAKMPEFASKLAHPVKRPSSPTSPALARAKMHPGPLQANDIYDNGPTNGNTDAWTINFGFIVSDSFNVTYSNTSVTGMSFAAWMSPGDVLGSVEVSITSSENGGTSYFDQIVNFTQSGCIGNEFGYNVCTQTGSFNGPALNNGAYWVNLQNASVSDGDPAYWDENSGPSSASENTIGTIPSESFTILGNATTTTSTSTTYNNYACPSPQPGFHDLHDFSSSAGPSGLAIDTAGKLYGTFANGGSYGAGLLYDFAQRAGHWFVTSLYSFLGGSNGDNPISVLVGPGGLLYGAAHSDNQSCGYGFNCGLIYEATPGPNACATALCGWNEKTIYQFTGNSDAWGGIVTAFDSAGNLYGIGNGGTYGAGAVFELSPSQGGWTEKILYSFTGQSDGGDPNSLLVGHDGNLYGTADLGGNYNSDGCYGWCGVVFQLAPTGSGWTENVIHAFVGGYTDGGNPSGLIQDPLGFFYGLSVCSPDLGTECNDGTGSEEAGMIFTVSSGGDFNIIYTYSRQEEGCQLSGNVTFHSLALDPNGNLYAAEGGVNLGSCGQNCFDYIYCGAIMNVAGGYPRFLVSGGADIFENLTSDANGNLYGTTDTCGFESPLRTSGMIWQYSP